jgi:FMN phosphatase YigB (HAD superfamily)
MSIENVILDFDGTVTDINVESKPYLKEFAAIFARKICAPYGGLNSLFESARKAISADPARGWVEKGKIVGPASADNYMLNTVAYWDVLQQLKSEKAKSLFAYKMELLPSDAKEDENLLQELHHSAYLSAKICFREGAKDFVEKLVAGFFVTILTNSKTDAVIRKLSYLGNYSKKILIKGDAKKYSLDDSFTEVPESAQPEGFPRPVFLRRKQYKKALDETGLQPHNTAVVGDVYEFDLALPEYLGYRTILLETQATQPYEATYLKTKKNSFLAQDYNQVLSFLKTGKNGAEGKK